LIEGCVGECFVMTIYFLIGVVNYHQLCTLMDTTLCHELEQFVP